MEILLAPIISHLGIMLFAALMVERLLYTINWFINRSIAHQTLEGSDATEDLDEAYQLAVRAAEEAKILLEDNKNSSKLEIEFNEALAPYANYAFDVQEIKTSDNARTPREKLEAWKRAENIKKEFWLQLFGTIVAIYACYKTDFSVDIFFEYASNTKADLEAIPCTWWGYVLTGIIIGSGSKPVNFLMNFLMDRKLNKIVEEVNEEKTKPINTEQTKVTTVIEGNTSSTKNAKDSIEDILGINYQGGYKPNRLEHSHLYKGDIDLLVYHHTASSSDDTFEDVVKIFDDRGWLTGYHCLVFKDGSIRTICRWDRYGNHARPVNGHSMGMAFVGNFEPDKNVPSSNWDGRYGLLTPTRAQLEAGAKLMAVWALLHDITPTFRRRGDGSSSRTGIVPHNYLAAKACPGKNFPYDLFEKKVLEFHTKWKNDNDFKESLEEFKMLPMVLPTKIA